MEKPQSFFKYTGAHGGRLLLENQTLKWSRPSEFNDPFDMQIDLLIGELDEKEIETKVLEHIYKQFEYDGEISEKDMLGNLVRELKRINPRIKVSDVANSLALGLPDHFKSLPSLIAKYEPEIKGLMETTKVLCLSEVSDDLLMWSHYADSHRGVVFEFINIPELDSPYSVSEPVRYGDDVPISYDTQTVANMLIGDTLEDEHRMRDNFLYTKSKDWAYEREWRISSGDGRNPDEAFEFIPFGAKELSAVYFGCKMSEEDKAFCIKLILEKYPHVVVYQAQKVRGKFALEFKKVEVK